MAAGLSATGGLLLKLLGPARGPWTHLSQLQLQLKGDIPPRNLQELPFQWTTSRLDRSASGRLQKPPLSSVCVGFTAADSPLQPFVRLYGCGCVPNPRTGSDTK
ncbi:hypothetical protein B0T10DRAFT_475921 [Thelonectria olida]|uniref:Uncharacterized protein n=1 Tax=Thelonectria olida TaxID=1576542 RepID=A0A9P8WCG5_9HYPO|nr:hypothetical protein B0T10DRAFT_475921 [Thelonectria olida]